MFGTTHGLVGLILAQKTRSIGTAFLAGAASHFLLDAVPHYQGKKEDAIIDGALGGPVLLYYAAALEDPPRNAAGVAGALIPDVLAFLQDDDAALNKIKKFMHPTAKKHLFMLPEILLASIALMYLRRRNNVNERTEQHEL